MINEKIVNAYRKREQILESLRLAINKQRELVMDDSKIRICMGRELSDMITRLYFDVSTPTKVKSAYGFPVEIDDKNPMRLEVYIVESVDISSIPCCTLQGGEL